MYHTTTPQAFAGGSLNQHDVFSQNGGRPNLVSIVNFVFRSAMSMSDRKTTQWVLEALTDVVHRAGIGRTPTVEVDLKGKRTLAKLETQNPTNSFKVRGAYIAVAAAIAGGAEKLTTATTGNHGAGTNVAANAFGVPVKIFVPAETPQRKTDLLRGPRTEICSVGGSFAEAKLAAELYAHETGAAFVAPYNAVETILGQATIGVELASLSQECFDAVVVQIGGGGLIAGISLALWASEINVPIFGVCVRAARGAFDSFHANPRGIVTRQTSPSIAGGVLVDAPGEIPFRIIDRLVKDVVLVSDLQIENAIAELHSTGIRSEGAGAVSAAAIIEGLIPASRPLFIVSGGNVSDEDHCKILQRASARQPNFAQEQVGEQ